MGPYKNVILLIDYREILYLGSALHAKFTQ